MKACFSSICPVLNIDTKVFTVRSAILLTLSALNFCFPPVIAVPCVCLSSQLLIKNITDCTQSLRDSEKKVKKINFILLATHLIAAAALGFSFWKCDSIFQTFKTMNLARIGFGSLSLLSSTWILSGAIKSFLKETQRNIFYFNKFNTEESIKKLCEELGKLDETKYSFEKLLDINNRFNKLTKFSSKNTENPRKRYAHTFNNLLDRFFPEAEANAIRVEPTKDDLKALNKPNISDVLPPEILHSIFLLVGQNIRNIRNIRNISLTSKHFNEIVNTNYFWMEMCKTIMSKAQLRREIGNAKYKEFYKDWYNYERFRGGAQLFVKTLTGKTVILNVNLSAPGLKVKHLKRFVQDELAKGGKPFLYNQIRLIFAGELLEDERLVSEPCQHASKLSNGSTIHLVLRIETDEDPSREQRNFLSLIFEA